MSPRRPLLRHLWAMVQARAEAAGLVVQLQRSAVTQGLLFGAIAAVTALSFITAVIVWIAVAAPPSWRSWALGLVALTLLIATVYSAARARRRFVHDATLVADFARGLKLDFALVDLALRDADSDDEDERAARERAEAAVREAEAEITEAAARDAEADMAEDASAEAPSAGERAMPDPLLRPDDGAELPASPDHEYPRREGHGTA